MTSTMTPEAATAVWAHLLPRIEGSRQLTRQLITSFPADRLDTRPVSHLGSFADMLWYLSSVHHVFLDGVCEGRFEPLPAMPRAPSIEHFLDWDETHFGPTLQKLKRLDGHDLLVPVTFLGVTLSRLEYLWSYLDNVVHHTAQVTAFLATVLPVPVPASAPGATSADAELTQDQLAGVAGGGSLSIPPGQIVYPHGNGYGLAPSAAQATLGSLLASSSTLRTMLPSAGLMGPAIDMTTLRFLLI